MTLATLICRPDGTQTVEEKEVPDGWFEPHEVEEKLLIEQQ